MATEQYQPLNINTGSAQSAIQGTEIVTPALENLMQGITSGLISLGDLQKRNANIPLETAQRNAELTDLQQLRPLQREAQTAQLQNLRAKQAFEAESLPILNDIKREELKQEFESVKQHGVPAATMAIFNKVVPGFASYNPEKLQDPKTGQLNTVYAFETIQTAIEKAEKLKSRSTLKPTSIKNVSKTGEETTFEQMIDPMSGQALGPQIPTGTKEVNVAEVEAKASAARAGLSNDVLKERNSSDSIKRYIPQAAAFDAVDEIRSRKTPPKNTDDLALVYELVKVLDPTSVVREGEAKFAMSTVPGVQQLANRVQGLINDSNRTFDVATRANIYATIDTLRAGAEKSVIPELKRISNLAIDRGVPLAQAFTEPELKLLVNGPTSAIVAPGSGAAPAATVVAAGTIPVVKTPQEARALPTNVQYFRDAQNKLRLNPSYQP